MGYDLINGRPTKIKDPDAILNYTWDWVDWLNNFETPDIIVSHQILLANSPSAVVVGSSVLGSKVTAIISGGAPGEKLAATCRINTAGGYTDDCTIYLKMKHK